MFSESTQKNNNNKNTNTKRRTAPSSDLTIRGPTPPQLAARLKRTRKYSGLRESGLPVVSN